MPGLSANILFGLCRRYQYQVLSTLLYVVWLMMQSIKHRFLYWNKREEAQTAQHSSFCHNLTWALEWRWWVQLRTAHTQHTTCNLVFLPHGRVLRNWKDATRMATNEIKRVTLDTTNCDLPHGHFPICEFYLLLLHHLCFVSICRYMLYDDCVVTSWLMLPIMQTNLLIACTTMGDGTNCIAEHFCSIHLAMEFA